MSRSSGLRLAFCPLVAACLALTLTAAGGAEAASVLDAERRLDRPITLSELRLPIGELLDQLSEWTGVQLEADDRRAPISGYEVTVVAHDQPVRSVLDGLARLYSVPYDRWSWSRRGDVLVLRSSAAPEAALRAREEFRHDFRMRQLAARRAFLALPEQARAAAAAGVPYLEALNRNPARSGAFFSFIAGLTEADFRTLASGGRIDLPVHSLSAAQRAFIDQEFARARPAVDGVPQSPADLARVQLHHSDGSIYLNMGALGSHAVLGGIWLDAAEREHGRREWLGGGESDRAPHAKLPAEEQRAHLRPEDLAILREPMHRLIYRLALVGRLNVLFDCHPWSQNATYGYSHIRLEGDLGEVLAALEREGFPCIWKRRDDFLLFRHVEWPRHRAAGALPRPVLRDLRASAAENDGYLRPGDWLRLAELTGDQLETLQAEFPDAGTVRAYRFLLSLAARMTEKERAALHRPAGATWNDLTRRSRERLLALMSPVEARNLRLVLHWVDGPPPKARLLLDPRPQPAAPREVSFRKQIDREAPPVGPPALEY